MFSNFIFPKPLYRIKKSNEKIHIDGILNETVWKTALEINLKYEIDPGENIEPPVKTKALLFYGKHSLFVAIIADDPNPEKIRVHYKKRDEIWEDDTVGIGIDSFNSGNRAFYFSSNAIGIQGDEIFSEGGNSEDASWDAIWDSAAKITDKGYIVEFEIPFNTIQFARTKEDLTWGIMFFRSYPRNTRHQIASIKVIRGESCWICNFDKIKGFKGIKPGKNMELDPTLTAFRTDTRKDFPNGEMSKEDSNIDIGISGKWGFTSNLNLSFAINPDFSQIEADASQLTINKQFALSYNEKRPFFLEGNDFFNSEANIIYTRAIADPDWGVKLSGKEKKHTIGLFLTHDKRTNLLFPSAEGSNETSLDSGVYSNVFRYKYDIGKSSTIGLIATDREGENYFNRVTGIDGLIRITKNDTLKFQFLHSLTKYPNDTANDYEQKKDSFSGNAIIMSYKHSNRNWSHTAEFEKFSKNFRADLGFIPRVDFYKITAGTKYTYYTKSKSFSMIGIGGDIEQTKDSGNNPIEKMIALEINASGPMQSFIAFRGGYKTYYYENIPYNQFFKILFFSVTPSKSLSLFFFMTSSDGIDYLHSRPGKTFTFNQSIKYNFGKHLAFSFKQIYSNFKIESEHLYDVLLSDFLLSYHFNKRLFIRGTVQYSYTKQNQSLYDIEVTPKTKRIQTQFLLSHKLNPRTVLFLGYSDLYNQDANLQLLRQNKTIFLKIGYALVF